MDGQQLSISWIDGKLRAARNKGQIKNWGENSLTVSGIKKKFAGRGELTKAFSKAMDDLNNAIANKGGHYTGVVRDSGRALGGMIKQISQDLQKTFTIQGPQVVSVPKDEDFENQQNYFLTQLGILRNKYNLNNSDKVSKYHEAFWSEKIDSAFYISKVQLPPGLKQNLINRFVRGDKSYTISKSNINDDKVYEVVKKMATEDFDKLFKQNIKPFEKLFFRLATRILNNVQNYISPSPEVSVQKLKKEIGTTLASFKGATDLKQIAKVKVHLDKIKSMGGFDAIVPSEGIVFKYKGKTLKFTGVFASANQLLGIIKYGN